MFYPSQVLKKKPPKSATGSSCLAYCTSESFYGFTCSHRWVKNMVLWDMFLDLIFRVAVISRETGLQCLRAEGRCLHQWVSLCCCRFFPLIPLLFVLVVFSRVRIFSLTCHLLWCYSNRKWRVKMLQVVFMGKQTNFLIPHLLKLYLLWKK